MRLDHDIQTKWIYAYTFDTSYTDGYECEHVRHNIFAENITVAYLLRMAGVFRVLI